MSGVFPLTAVRARVSAASFLIQIIGLMLITERVSANTAEPGTSFHPMDLRGIPSRMDLRGSWQAGPVFASAVSGDRIYFGTGGQLRVLHLNSGDTPDWEELAGTTISGVVKDLVTDDEHIFVADESGFLHVLEITDSGPPRQVGVLNIPDNARGIDVVGKHVQHVDASLTPKRRKCPQRPGHHILSER